MALSEQERDACERLGPELRAPDVDHARTLVCSAGELERGGVGVVDHAEAERPEDTDWQEIAALYERLAQLTPSPVVQLNRAAAMAMADGPLAGLMLLDQLKLDEALDSYYLFHATRADLLRRLNERDSACAEYECALALCHNEAEQMFLRRRMSEVTSR